METRIETACGLQCEVLTVPADSRSECAACPQARRVRHLGTCLTLGLGARESRP